MAVCAIPDEIHLNDIGTKFRVTVMEGDTAVDLTGFSSIDFIFLKPDKTPLNVTGTAEDVPNGIVSYTTVSGDLDQTGRWKIQIALVLPAWTGKSNVTEFTVYPNL